MKIEKLRIYEKTYSVITGTGLWPTKRMTNNDFLSYEFMMRMVKILHSQ